MKKLKKIHVASMKRKMIWLFVYSFILNVLLFYITNSLIQEGFVTLIELPTDRLDIDGADFSLIAMALTATINFMGTVFSIIFTGFFNLFLSLIITGVFRILYFRSIAEEKATFLKYLKITIISVPLLGTILLVIINFSAFPLNFLFSFTHYLSFLSISGFLLWEKTNQTYSEYELNKEGENI